MNLKTIDRLPPHSNEAEQAIIGALIQNVKIAYPICAEVIGEDLDAFYDLRHRILFETSTRMFLNGSAVDLVTLYEQLRLDGKSEAIGGASYLAALPDFCASAENVGYYAEILMQHYRARRLIALGAKLVSDTYEGFPVKDTVEESTQALAEIARAGTASAVKPVRTLVSQAIDEIEKFHQRHGMITGISSGFPDLDRMTNGFHPGEMIVIAGRPSSGKTSLGMNIAEHVAIDAKLPVGVFSLEMTAESLILRMLCSRARVNLRNVRDGFLAERDFPRITGAAGKLASCPLHIDDTGGLSIFEVQRRARRMAESYGIKLFVIDYLQLMHGRERSGRTRENEVAEISSGVKSISKELKVPVIVLSQLNRDQEKNGNRCPRLSDIRESGSVENDADFVGMLWRPCAKDQDSDEEQSQDAVAVNLNIAKQRNGPTGQVPLTFLKGYTRFESAAKVEADDYRQPMLDA